MTTKEQILHLIGEYWDLAYAEGAEHRPLDTPAGSAQQKLAAIAGALDQVFSDADRLRTILSESAAAIGNGAWCSPHASVEFMSEIPNEIAMQRASIIAVLEPLQLVHDCIVRERQGWTNEAFIVFESSLDERVRFTFGDLAAIINAVSPQPRPVAA